MVELEDANVALAAKDEKLDSPSSRASFQISPSYWAPRLSSGGSATKMSKLGAVRRP